MQATGTQVTGLSTHMKVGLAGAAVAVAGSLKLAEQGVRDFASQTGEVRKLVAATGESAEGASQLRNQMVGLGIDTDTALKTVAIFSRNLVESAGKFDQYGIAIERTKNGQIDVAATLRNVAVAYQATNGPAEKNAMLTDLLGRNSAVLRPLLAANRTELERLAKTGPIYSQKDLATGKEFARQSRELGIAVERLGVSLGKGLVPMLTSALDGMTKLANGANWVGEKVGGVLNVVGKYFWLVRGAGSLLGRLGGSHKEAGDAAEQHGEQEAELAEQESAAADAAAELTDRLEELAGAQRDALGAQMSVTDAHHSAWENAIDLVEAEEELAEAIREHGAESREALKAEVNLEAARQSSQKGVIALAQALTDQEVAQRRATGESITTQQEMQIFKQRLIEFAATVKDPMRAEILLLATNIRDIPDSHDTVITADTSAAEARIRALKTEIANLGPGGGRGAELQAEESGYHGEARPPLDPSLDFSGEFPQAAEGAYVKHSPGGTLVRVGEGGQDEVITPVPDIGPTWDQQQLEEAFRRAITGLTISVDRRVFGQVVDQSLEGERRRHL